MSQEAKKIASINRKIFEEIMKKPKKLWQDLKTYLGFTPSFTQMLQIAERIGAPNYLIKFWDHNPAKPKQIAIRLRKKIKSGEI